MHVNTHVHRQKSHLWKYFPGKYSLSDIYLCSTFSTIKLLLLFFFTREQLSDLHICGLPEQPDQSWYAPAVLEGDLVVVVGFAVHQVPQGSTGTAVHISHPVVQQVH